MSKAITLCADDFSLNPAINAGILDLLDKKRLSAVSCMTQSPTWLQDAPALLPYKDNADIGLHFNLTHPFPDCYTLSLMKLMLQSNLGFVPKQKVHDSFCFQLDQFENTMNCIPDFIDGHQHVHIFPVVRDIIINEYVKRYSNAPCKPYMRSLQFLPADTKSVKASILQCMGAKTHGDLLVNNRIPHNRAFAGIYNFNPEENIDQRMNQWLSALPNGGLIMCHPGMINQLANDSITGARFNEYRYLSGKDFPERLKQCHTRLARIT